jgi:PAS domain S-box-containing protein/putative nucleotidyltransferase with HDIG domain
VSTDPAAPSLDHLRLLLDALNCGAIMIDRAGTIVHANERLCRMMKLPCSALLGRSVESFYATDEERKHIRDVLENFERDHDAEFHLPLPDGTILPIVYASKRIPGPPPLSDHRIVTMIDITRQKEAEGATKENYQFIVQMSDTVLEQALELKRHAEKLEERVRQRTRELHEAHMEAIYMLAVAAEAKDMDTGKHVRRIERYTRLIADRIGLSKAESEAIGYSAILHDIGKIHVPDRILSKPGPLDDDERTTMQQHTLAGERILSNTSFFDRARRIARSHHENWDGSGYPDHLAGDAIPLEARIVHVADVYDALTSERVYKQPWPRERAVEAILRERGRMFAPEVADAFKALAASGAFRSNGNG